MSSRRVLAAVLAFAFALDVHDAQAQGVPAVSVDLDVGAGSTSARAGDIYFRSTISAWVGADMAIRIGGAGQLRPVVVLGYSFRGFASSDRTSDCPFAPNGSCKAFFPDTYGASIGVGLRQALGKWALLGATAGVASYERQARFAEIDASVRVAPRVAIMGEFRYIDLPVESARAWFRPLSLGVRLF